MEDTYTNPLAYKYLVVNKGTKDICWRKKPFRTNGAWKTVYVNVEE